MQTAKSKVEAYTASWIEMYRPMANPDSQTVEAYTASWIEIAVTMKVTFSYLSRLIQPRGLKFFASSISFTFSRRGLYSLVDWNLWLNAGTAGS